MRIAQLGSVAASALWLSLVWIPVPVAAETPASTGGACPRFAESSEGLPTKLEWRTHPVFGDVNGDGHLDLAGHPRKGPGPGVWLGDGEGAWTPVEQNPAFPPFSCGVGVDLQDVNGDGHLDLGVADHCKGLFVYFGDGEGRWRMGPLVDPIERQGREDLAFGDIDGDGVLDLFAVSTEHGGLQLYRGAADGGWTRDQRGLPTEGSGRSVSLADLNGDGRPDVLATGHFPPAHPIVWLSQADGSYRAAGEALPPGSDLQSIEAADVNRDGIQDLVATGRAHGDRPPLLVYLGDGAGGWSLAVEGLPKPETGDTFHGVVAADLNGDGHVDLAAMDWGGAGLGIWLGNGEGHWRACTETGLPAPASEFSGEFGYGLATADVNRDGKPDLAAAFGLAPNGSMRFWLQR